ncbi:HAMP domain protein, partial [Vibrio harveyi]
LRESDSL